jgi:hypothetical protein
MDLRLELGALLLSTQPPAIISCLVRNDEFLTQSTFGTATYPGLGTFNHNDIVAKLQQAHTSSTSATIVNTDGKVFRIDRSEIGVTVTPVDQTDKGRLVLEFGLADPDICVRRKAIEAFSSECVPFENAIAGWSDIAQLRPLEELETRKLIEVLTRLPKLRLGQIFSKWQTGEVKAADLVPSDSEYYEALVGPAPREVDSESYIQNSFIAYRKKVSKSSSDLSIKYTLPLGAFSSANLIEILSDVPDDKILDSILNLGEMATPHALVGALEISFSRASRDPKYLECSRGIISKLMNAEYSVGCSRNIYRFYPVIAAFALRKINSIASLRENPPYWRRLAAMLHANQLCEILLTTNYDEVEFLEWIDGQSANIDVLSEQLDAWTEPAWSVVDLNERTFRASIVGRVLALARRYPDIANQIDASEFIETVTSEMKNVQATIEMSFPCPIEGQIRPSKIPTPNMTNRGELAATFSALKEKLEAEPSGNAWRGLYLASRLFTFDDSLVAVAVKAASGLSPKAAQSIENVFENIACAGFIAAVQPCPGLAEALGKQVCFLAKEFNSRVSAENGLRAIVIAAGAFDSRSDSLEWLKKTLESYALNLPAGLPIRQLFGSLTDVKSLLPAREWRLATARSICASAL